MTVVLYGADTNTDKTISFYLDKGQSDFSFGGHGDENVQSAQDWKVLVGKREREREIQT